MGSKNVGSPWEHVRLLLRERVLDRLQMKQGVHLQMETGENIYFIAHPSVLYPTCYYPVLDQKVEPYARTNRLSHPYCCDVPSHGGHRQNDAGGIVGSGVLVKLCSS